MAERSFGIRTARVEDELFEKFESLKPAEPLEVGNLEHLKALKELCKTDQDRQGLIHYALGWLGLTIPEICPVVSCPHLAMNEIRLLANAIASKRTFTTEIRRYDHAVFA